MVDNKANDLAIDLEQSIAPISSQLGSRLLLCSQFWIIDYSFSIDTYIPPYPLLLINYLLAVNLITNNCPSVVECYIECKGQSTTSKKIPMDCYHNKFGMKFTMTINFFLIIDASGCAGTIKPPFHWHSTFLPTLFDLNYF